MCVLAVHTSDHTMATLFKNKNSPIWRARYTNAEGRRVSKTTGTKKQPHTNHRIHRLLNQQKENNNGGNKNKWQESDSDSP